MMICGIAFADDLPGPVPENQIFGTTSHIDGIALAYESTSFRWNIGDQESDEIPAPYGSAYGIGSVKSGSISYSMYKDIINSNGGQISEVKAFHLDTNAKSSGMYNVNTEKILTYNSQMGSHLLGDELYILDVAGNWTWTPGVTGLLCVFTTAFTESLIPSFCNKATASARLTSLTTGLVETGGSIRPIAASRTVPSALNYEISITPDMHSASGYADAIVSTKFTISVQEGRTDGNFSPGLVPGMFSSRLATDQVTGMHGANGMLLNAGAVTSFEYGDTGRENSIFIGNSSGYLRALSTNDPYDSGITPSTPHCSNDVNIGGPLLGSPGCSAAYQDYWADDVIVIVKDGEVILSITGTELQGGNLVGADGTILGRDPAVAPGSAGSGAQQSAKVDPLRPGTQILVDGILLTKNAGSEYGDCNPTGCDEVSWTVEFTDYFGRIPPGSIYTLGGGTASGANNNYSVENIVTAPPYLEFYDELGASLQVVDRERGAGGINSFLKSFEYTSGIACENC
jgi:hypothetical protein